MSMINEILRELWESEHSYKGMRVNIFGIPKFKKYNKKSLQITVDRLNKKGIIEKELKEIVLSKYGKEYVKRKFNSLKQFDKPDKISSKRDLLLMFDVPTEKKAHREWLRWHLKKFNYVLIQKSVWVGPSPLPKEFNDYLKEIKLNNCIKTFKLEKPYK